MSKCVSTWDSEGESECFELTDLATKETYIFKVLKEFFSDVLF